MTEKNQQIAEYSKTEAELSKLREKCSTTVYDIKTPQGMKTAVSLRAEIRTNRTGIEKVRKEVKAPILALGKLVDSEAERLTNELLALEKPIDEAIKAEDARKAKVATFFESAKQVIIDCVGKDSAFIKEKGDKFSLIAIDEAVFLTKFQDAININNETLDKLGEMILDAESKEISAEKAEKLKQAILAKIAIFNVSLQDISSVELIAAKRLQIETTIVDVFYGEFEQQAHDAKSNALEYLLNAEHDLIRAQEAIDQQARLDEFNEFKAKCEALGDSLHSVEYLEYQLSELVNPSTIITGEHTEEWFKLAGETIEKVETLYIPSAKQRAVDLAEKLKAEQPIAVTDDDVVFKTALAMIEVTPVVAELLPEAIPAIVEQISVENSIENNAVTDEMLDFISTVEYSNDVASRHIRMMAAELKSLRAKYERLLWLTTPKPIETAPIDTNANGVFQRGIFATNDDGEFIWLGNKRGVCNKS